MSDIILGKLDEWECIYRNMGDFQRADDYKQTAQEIRRLEQENRMLMDGPDLERKFWDAFIRGVSQVDFRGCHSDPAEYSDRINEKVKGLKQELEEEKDTRQAQLTHLVNEEKRLKQELEEAQERVKGLNNIIVITQHRAENAEAKRDELKTQLEEAQRHAKGMAKVADNHKRAEQTFQTTLKMIARQKLEDTELAANSQEIRSELFVWCVKLARKSLQPQQPSDVIEGKKNGEHS